MIKTDGRQWGKKEWKMRKCWRDGQQDERGEASEKNLRNI